jgi:RNA polymerase subunit RPABC4/transcription elongation factor Spt4
MEQHNKHNEIKQILKVIGPIMIIVGIVLLVIAFRSTFMNPFDHISMMGFGNQRQNKFYLGFIGLPLIAIGAGITNFAFMGEVARYTSKEISPVAKETFNYLANGTKEGIKDITEAIHEGKRRSEGPSVATDEGIKCLSCGIFNNRDANFCKNCAKKLEKEVKCTHCQRLNDADASFCDQCGSQLNKN